MKLLTEDAVLRCAHVNGKADADHHRQSFVRIDGAHVLVGRDPRGRSVGGCPLMPPLKPCKVTLSPAAGHSTFVRIDGVPVCLDTITGPTDSVPPAVYTVSEPGQSFVEANR